MSYTSPVVVGQVMTANDPAFSVFWARGADSTAAPSNSALFVGKHVGEDSNRERLAETIGYIVIEGGKGTIGETSETDGVEYLAAVGADVVQGMDDGPSNYHLNVSSIEMTFNETIDAGSVGVDDLELSAGAVMRAEVLPSGTSVQYTLVGGTPALMVEMGPRSVLDQDGNPMLPFSETYHTRPTKFYVLNGISTGHVFEYARTELRLPVSRGRCRRRRKTGLLKVQRPMPPGRRSG